MMTVITLSVRITVTDRPILGSTHTLVLLLHPWIRLFTIFFLLGGFEQASNLCGKKANVKQNTGTSTSKIVNPMQVWICPKNSTTVAFL